MAIQIPEDVVDSVIGGENFKIEGVIECMWLPNKRLSVTSLYGGFQRPLTPQSKESMRTSLRRIVDKLNAME